MITALAIYDRAVYILDRSVLNRLAAMAQVGMKRSVGRPRQFDEGAALEAALEAFWQKGYESTSLTDLCACTGLHKGSLYQTFGDKHQLFMKALKHYADNSLRDIATAAIESESPLENLRSVLHTSVGHAQEGKGCMMINSLVELAPHDSAVRETLLSIVDRRRRLLTDLIQKAQATGQIRSDIPAERIVRQVMLTLAGAATTLKGFINHDQAIETLDDVLASLA